MRTGLATIALRRYDVFQAIDLAAEAGFDGVEIMGRLPHTPDEFDEDYTRRVKDRLRANGLRVSMFGSYVNPDAPDYEQRAEDALKIAKLLRARLIRVWAGCKEPHEADEETWNHVTRCLHEFALQAADLGITLAVEMHGGTLCATAEGCMRLIEGCGSPDIKLNYQVYDHMEPDIEHVIGLVGDSVVNIHAQSYRPSCCESGKLRPCLIREGLVDYDKVLTLLSAHGFDGYIEVEFLKGEHDSEEALLDALRRDAAYLRELISKHTTPPLAF